MPPLRAEALEGEEVNAAFGPLKSDVEMTMAKKTINKAKKPSNDCIILFKNKLTPRWRLLGGEDARFFRKGAMEDAKYLKENLRDRTTKLMVVKIVKEF